MASWTPDLLHALQKLFENGNESAGNDDDTGLKQEVSDGGAAKAEEPEDDSEDDDDDGKKEPSYTINFQQDLNTEDLFLRLGNRTPLTSSCETLVVRIFLPGETMSTITSRLKPRHLKVKGQGYRLGLYLPQRCDPRRSSAKWRPEEQTLEIRAHLVRELDPFNF
ncbi:unnamed protein product [Darwinula stevensoni]|uniref:PIH1D1/2/3 CS-like domain-containing protein n=1 Tax=Darwinula stevensoni TaxID=69355 RepID=A0A7R8X4P2_9CRUS|nr:unnamed protein product [Darwinula stevensoni]CAG0886260.1 unnamed protein product [Darwinula stevensoni]